MPKRELERLEVVGGPARGGPRLPSRDGSAGGAPAACRTAEIKASLAARAAQIDCLAMAAAILEAAEELFGAHSSICALSVDGPLRVSRFRGIDPDRMAAASRHEDFRSFLSGDELRLDPPTDPVVQALAPSGAVAAGLPLLAGGRRLGRLVLLLPHQPAAPDRGLLYSFAGHAALCLLACDLGHDVRDSGGVLSSLLHAVSQPVVVVDAAGCVMGANPAAAQTFHLAPGFLKGQSVAGRLGHRSLEEMLTSGRESAVETVIGTVEPRVYRAVVRRLRGSGGRVTGRVLVLDDVTGQRQIAALKADLVAVIGHELRTPITVVKGYLRVLVRKDTVPSDARQAQALAGIESNVDRLERLVEDLLFLADVDQGGAAPSHRTHDLTTLLQAQAGGRVIVHTPPGPVRVEMDDARIAKVLRHLLDNALEHSQAEVVIELSVRDTAVEVSVRDAGRGIFSGDVPQLFERFRQLDGSSTRAHGGLGVGLYICRRIVEAMGGRIWCESRLGVGSRFVFSLPLTSAESPAL